MPAKNIYFSDGKHRIENLDLNVEDVMRLLSSGVDIDYIIDHFPPITEDDIKACIDYAEKNMPCHFSQHKTVVPKLLHINILFISNSVLL